MFEKDINLAYKLLRYTNSAAFKRRSEISTIKQAIVVLGQSELRKFLSVLFTAQCGTNKPEELTILAMIRARFAEELANLAGHAQQSSIYFLTGLMSLIDAILDESIEDVMKQLPLAQEIKSALIDQEGELAEFLDLVKLYEKAEWELADQKMKTLGLDPLAVPELYENAVSWAREQAQAISN